MQDLLAEEREKYNDELRKSGESQHVSPSPGREHVLSVSTAVFTVPLSISAKNTSTDGKGCVPALISDSIDWLNRHALKTEGLWRRPGNVASMDDLEMAWADGRVEYGTMQSPFDICSLLLRYFKMQRDSLSNPIWTNLLDKKFQACRTLSGSQLTARVHELVWKLPEPNRMVLRLLTDHFRRVIQNSVSTKMDIANIATCVFLQHTAALTCMIQDHDEIFTQELEHSTIDIPGERYTSKKFLAFQKSAVDRLDSRLSSEEGSQILALHAKMHNGNVAAARKEIYKLLKRQTERKYDEYLRNKEQQNRNISS